MKREQWPPFFPFYWCFFTRYGYNKSISYGEKNLDSRSCITYDVRETQHLKKVWDNVKTVHLIFLTFFTWPGNRKSLYLNIVAETNKRALGLSKIYSSFYMITIFEGFSRFEHFALNYRKKTLPARRAKTSSMIPSLYCNFLMSYMCLSIVPSLKKIWIVHPFQGNYLNCLIVLLVD